MPISYIKKTIDMLSNSESKERKIILFGGEPLLEWEKVKETINYGKKKDIKFMINTNGTIQLKNKIKFLKDNNIEMRISLNEINSAESFSSKPLKKALENIHLCKTKSYDIEIGLLINKQNYRGFYKIYKSICLKTDTLIRFSIAMGEGFTYANTKTIINEINKIMDFLKEYRFKDYYLILKDYITKDIDNKEDIFNDIAFMPDGKFIICPYCQTCNKKIIGDIEKGIKKEFLRPKTKKTDICKEICQKMDFNKKKPLNKAQILAQQRLIKEFYSILKKHADNLEKESKINIYNIIITNKCNLNCRYCYAKKNNKSMNLNTAKKTISFLKNNSKSPLSITFGGNEPLLNYNIFKYMVEEIKKIDKDKKADNQIILFTNCESLTPELLKFCKNNNISFHISLDGTEELHIKYRDKTKKNFKKVIDTIKKLNKTDIDYTVTCIVTKDHLKKYKEITDTIINNKIKRIDLRMPQELGNAKDKYKQISISSTDYIEFLIKIENELKKNKSKSINMMYEELKTRKNEKKAIYKPECIAIREHLTIDPDGNIYPCDESRQYKNEFILGNVNSSDIKSIILNKNATHFLNKNPLCIKCDNIPCGECYVLNVSTHENKNLIKKNIRCFDMKKFNNSYVE